MIGFLRGVLLDKEPSRLLIEVNGVGYEIQFPSSYFANLPVLGKELSLYIHMASREDGEYLYGFTNKSQRSLFRSLIKISGVGPRIALAILSAMEPQTFAAHLANGDVQTLEQIPGIGAKTARRLIVEMKDRLDEWNDLDMLTALPTASRDAVSALVSLGYRSHEAQKAIAEFGDKNLSREELIRLALKKMQ